MKLQPSIETARLRLRPPGPEDQSELARLAGDEAVAATTIRIPHPYSLDDARGFIALAEARRAEGLAWIEGIEQLEDGAFVGCVGLEVDRANRSGELGYWIGVPYWGRGYATEAAAALVAFGFDTLALERIHAHHLAGNAASGRVLEKVGMRREGVLRQHVVKGGRRHDIVYHGLLRAEHESGRLRTAPGR